QSGGAGIQPNVGRCVPRLGLANSLPAERDSDRRRTLGATLGSGNADLSAACRREQDRARAHARGHPQAAEADPAFGAGAHGPAAPVLVFIAIALSLVPHDMMYGPQAALIAESFTPRLRYSGASMGYQLASIIAGGPAPLIATMLFAQYGSGYAIAAFMLVCCVISLAAAAAMTDRTHRDISQEYDRS